MRAALGFAAVLACLSLALAALSLPECCKAMDGSDLAGCTCLTEDVEVNGQFVELQGQKNYHWILTNWSVINVPDNVS
jgi:hypothetical protein